MQFFSSIGIFVPVVFHHSFFYEVPTFSTRVVVFFNYRDRIVKNPIFWTQIFIKWVPIYDFNLQTCINQGKLKKKSSSSILPLPNVAVCSYRNYSFMDAHGLQAPKFSQSDWHECLHSWLQVLCVPDEGCFFSHFSLFSFSFRERLWRMAQLRLCPVNL